MFSFKKQNNKKTYNIRVDIRICKIIAFNIIMSIKLRLCGLKIKTQRQLRTRINGKNEI